MSKDSKSKTGENEMLKMAMGEAPATATKPAGLFDSLCSCFRAKQVVPNDSKKAKENDVVVDSAEHSSLSELNKDRERRRAEKRAARARGDATNEDDEYSDDDLTPEQRLAAKKKVEMEAKRVKAVIIVQSTVRMFLGKCKMRHLFDEVTH